MTMLEAVRSVLAQYATFSGRARRSEYWFWTLAAFVVQVAGSLVDQLLDLSFVEWVVIALTFVPSIAVGSRRLHDTGRSGWLQLLWIIPIVGPRTLAQLDEYLAMLEEAKKRDPELYQKLKDELYGRIRQELDKKSPGI